MRQDQLIGGLLVITGAALALEATTFDVAFMTDPVGPKALPLLVAAMFVAGGTVALVRPRSDVTLPSTEVLARMGCAVVAFLVYAAALPWLGFFLSTTLVVTALSVLYRGPLLHSSAAAALLAGGLWLLFVRLLSLPLPIGELWIR
ncbi:MAG: tripartite tricarboxylate transporter TctB family protein [Gemmatimonadetes bacterium]|nr:tripartite tricarboxylate transporter TctB family protein [Gemmatimonadota bacterium]NNL29890.1 tripartite tricarboxylate transporter TctB family protein [Gemmatimonadota bacterium]